MNKHDLDRYLLHFYLVPFKKHGARKKIQSESLLQLITHCVTLQINSELSNNGTGKFGDRGGDIKILSSVVVVDNDRLLLLCSFELRELLRFRCLGGGLGGF